jgi:ABC-type uncharacterized transport system involved in gliding motility auxiliary subunit
MDKSKLGLIGKVCGGVGLLLLLSTLWTYLISLSTQAYLLAKLVSALLLVAVYLGTHFTALRRSSTDASTMGERTRAGFFYVSSAVMVALALVALGALNFIVAKRNRTWDLTRKQIFTLAPQTQSALAALKEPIEAIAFLPSNHPAYLPLEALFRRYQEHSSNFSYAFKDPLRNPDLAARYQVREGETPVVLTRGESHTTLRVASEEDLTNALIKLNAVGEQKAYFTTGHGEWPLSAEGAPRSNVAEMVKSLIQEGYSPAALPANTTELPRDAALVIIAGARTAFSSSELAALSKYLSEGGRLLYFAELGLEPGLDQLLAAYGLQVDPGVVADDKINPLNPYDILTQTFSEHEITSLLAELEMAVRLPTVRGLSILRDAAGVTTIPLVLTSQFAWVETEPSENPRASEGEKSGQIPLVAVSSKKTADSAQKRFDDARVVVFGDSELLVGSNWSHEGNRNLVLNSLAWASTQHQKITLRPKRRDLSSLDMDQARLSQVRFLAMDFLPVTTLAIGLAIWLARRNK